MHTINTMIKIKFECFLLILKSSYGTIFLEFVIDLFNFNQKWNGEHLFQPLFKSKLLKQNGGGEICYFFD